MRQLQFENKVRNNGTFFAYKGELSQQAYG